jgi:hypothetical protein
MYTIVRVTSGTGVPRVFAGRSVALDVTPPVLAAAAGDALLDGPDGATGADIDFVSDASGSLRVAFAAGDPEAGVASV